MTTAEFNVIATEKFNTISTSDLIVELKKIVSDFSDAADAVQDIIMDILIERMPESEFVELCNSL